MTHWLLALTLAALIALPGPPIAAHDTKPAHYHVGEAQWFAGLLCKDQAQAEQIFRIWVDPDGGLDKAKEMFAAFVAMQECQYISAHNPLHGFFNAQLFEAEIPLTGPNGKEQNHRGLLFSISPQEGHEIVDYLVTWEKFPGIGL